MENTVIRPSMKTVQAAYIAALAFIVAGLWCWYEYAAPQWPDAPAWLPVLLLVALLPPLRMHLSRRLITLSLHDDHLTLETGFLSRTRRTVDMVKIQDVTVRQTLGQRILGTGDLLMETAGESGGMLICNLDRPRAIADAILNSSKRGRVFL